MEMNENIENVLVTLDNLRTNDEMTYSAYSTLHDKISLMDDLLKEQEPKLVDNIQIRTLDTVGDCPSCGIGVSKRYHPMHCGLCGQAVKWNES